ncbi:MAG TPA: protease, partial [Cyanobacteria bacterium UBA8543]|nr:protease [Cyanobacteria bacterium UBA8543]
MSDVQKLSGLTSQDYEHPFDRSAREALEATPGLKAIVSKLNEYGIERVLKIQYTGSNLKANSKNFPELDGTIKTVCETLYVASNPDLYIRWDYGINAFTAGVEKTIIVMNSGCIDLLSPEELSFVVGHEIGHIKSQHILYYQMAAIMPVLADIIGEATLGIGKLLTTGVQLALLNWNRMSEFTADRAGLLACQDINIAIQSLIKIAGLPQKFFNSSIAEDFIAQAKEFEQYDLNTLDKVVKVMSIMGRSHPWT